MSKSDDIPLTIEGMFQHYLSEIGLDKKKISAAQYSEMRRTHYAAISSFLVAIEQAEKIDDAMDEFMKGVIKETTEFWKKHV